MTIDAARLRALAEAATPGPWEADDHGFWRWTDKAARQGKYVLCAEYEYDTGVTMQCSDADAAYIAAASPDAILALLDERDAIERERDEAQTVAGIKRLVDRCVAAEAERDALAAIVESARGLCRAIGDDPTYSSAAALLTRIDALDGAKEK